MLLQDFVKKLQEIEKKYPKAEVVFFNPSSDLMNKVKVAVSAPYIQKFERLEKVPDYRFNPPKAEWEWTVQVVLHEQQ